MEIGNLTQFPCRDVNPPSRKGHNRKHILAGSRSSAGLYCSSTYFCDVVVLLRIAAVCSMHACLFILPSAGISVLVASPQYRVWLQSPNLPHQSTPFLLQPSTLDRTEEGLVLAWLIYILLQDCMYSLHEGMYRTVRTLGPYMRDYCRGRGEFVGSLNSVLYLRDHLPGARIHLKVKASSCGGVEISIQTMVFPKLKKIPD